MKLNQQVIVQCSAVRTANMSVTLIHNTAQNGSDNHPLNLQTIIAAHVFFCWTQEAYTIHPLTF